MTTIARILQWSFNSVRPLLFSRRPSVREVAQAISGAGWLQVVQVKKRVGYVQLLVYCQSRHKTWLIKIRPVHFGDWETSADSVFDFNTLRYIKLKYSEELVAPRYPHDPSSYLTIEDVR